MKKLTLLLLTLVMIVALAACGDKCEHTYLSDCAEICNDCGETRTTTTEHYYYGDCDDGCHNCGEDREVTAQHSWKPATCTTGEACEGCGAVKSEALGHTWREADCTTPKTCTLCQTTEGDALGHTPAEDDGDCSTDVICTVCGGVATHAGQHTPNNDDGDCTTAITCSDCGTVTTDAKEAHTPNADDGNCLTAITCSDCGTVTTEAKQSHTPNADDGNCLTAITCSDCGTVTTEAKEAHTPNADDGNCLTAITCSVCGTVTTEAKEAHTLTVYITNSDGTHTPACEYCHHLEPVKEPHTDEDDGDCTTFVVCSKCGLITKDAKEAHTPNADDGSCLTAITCSDCGTVTTPARDNHTGGIATCVGRANCEVCNTEYDTTKNPNNHDLTTVDDNGVCGCGQLLTLVIINSGVTTNYDNFADALAAWTDGTTLTLFSDVTDLTDYITTTAKGLTLDLNGHTLASTDAWTLKVDAASELTIRDGKGTGYIDGPVIAAWTSSGDCGTILLESGTLEEVRANGIFTMTGGTIKNEAGTGVALQIDNYPDNVLITGGEIYGSDYGIWITSGNVIISGDTKITGADQYAIRSFSSEVVVSGAPTISGGAGEFCLSERITLNTQPADGEVWRVKIDTGSDTGIKDGIFALPGEGVTLDASKFASAMDGYEVKKNDKGELLLCNHAVSYYAVANGDGTHNMTCYCGGTVLETNLACSGGMATDTHFALCQYCGVAYGELDPNIHYDIYTMNMTAEELQVALTELLLAGQTEISIFLADADAKMLAAIDAAFNSSNVDKDNVKLTFGSQNTVQNEEQLTRALENGGIILLTADIALPPQLRLKKNTTIILNGYTLTPGVNGLGVEEGCTLTVIGDGNVNGDDGLWVFNGTLNLQGGTVDYLYVNETVGTANISGGKVTTLIVDYDGTVNISGGYVGKHNNYDGTIIITGGTFGFDPTEYLAEGYTATYNETDGIWTVTQNN